jgi:hypothetical protein
VARPDAPPKGLFRVTKAAIAAGTLETEPFGLLKAVRGATAVETPPAPPMGVKSEAVTAVADGAAVAEDPPLGWSKVAIA